jgi:AraC-like DNA-binding protein
MSGGFTAGGAWSLRFPAPEQIIFAAIAKGGCWFRVDGQKTAVRGQEGDVALVSGSKGYVVASDLAAPPVDALRVFAENGTPAKVGDGSDCVVLAGAVSLHPSNMALVTGVLPALVMVPGSSNGAPALRWIVEQILREQSTPLPGSDVASAQLAQLLFTQILRVHLASGATLPAGWLRAACDGRLAPALRRMHAAPQDAWTLAELAKAAGMSRTNFAVHFKSVAGVAPLTYLAEWRMRLAEWTLRREDTPVSEIAASLGYASESAFSNAFKRVTGTRPSDYRNRERRIATAAASM